MASFMTGVRLHDYGKSTPSDLFATVKKDGYDSVQLVFPKAVLGVEKYDDIGKSHIEAVLQAKKEHQMEIAVLGNYVELAIADAGIRKENTELFIRQLETAKAVGAYCIGTETTAMALQPTGTTRAHGMYLLCRSLEKILPEAERLGVTVAIEPVSWHSMYSPEAAKGVLDAMSSPALKIIFDAGNLLTLPEVDTQKQLWDRVGTLLGDKICAVHYKTQTFDPDGTPRATDLAHNRIDWDLAFEMLRELPQMIPVIREEANPAMAAVDVADIRRLIRG